MTVIDVHTHMLSEPWLKLLKEYGPPRYEVRPSKDAAYGIHLDGAPFMTPQPGHWDYKLRLKEMNKAKVDLAIVSLTCPNVYFGPGEISLKAAQIANDEMAEAQRTYPDRIRFLCSLPWEYPDLAVKELERATKAGAVGVMVLANIGGASLTDPKFAPIWAAIDRKGLPVLVHPTAPPGTPVLDMRAYNLIASVGFMFDTSLAVSRMIFDGFFEQYKKVKIIVGHAGATLPYLVGRLDTCFDNMNAARIKISKRPSYYMKRIWYDAVTYRPESLRMCLDVGGEDKVMYGSDYPHNIGSMKGCLKRVNDLPAKLAKKVRSANAEKIFRL
ncbi:MAG: 2-amino-3-carboxymuconate-6-semialdehyde decarboxylase [Alphaproteobacteria bacterium]|nr:2-amino-3-carboxymuconate-6-semialdehyde decarboxylase [Alphaproteobacteria bacterium]